MEQNFRVAITGDSIINRRISVITDERFLALVKVMRDADVTYTHLETLIHDYDGPEVYPTAEAGWTWMRSPKHTLAELKWAGVDIVSHASNHALDYSYGGLRSTWAALNEAGLPYAGTGENLGEARKLAYLETAKGRVSLISMCSSFVPWNRAGEVRRDMKGRPGINPLRYYFKVDRETYDSIKALYVKLGYWITDDGRELLINPPGIHNTISRFVLSDQPGVTTAIDEADLDGNLKAIKDARRQSDVVMVHLHYHEWDPVKGLHSPPSFAQPFARACIDAGADVFIGQGSHAELRGIEIYQGRPIFYDTGDFFRMSDSVTKMPADFFWRAGYGPEAREWDATPADAFLARKQLPKPVNPAGGYHTARVQGCVVAECEFTPAGKLQAIKLHPANWLHGKQSLHGVPALLEGAQGQALIEYLAELSSPFGTEITYENGVGVISL